MKTNLFEQFHGLVDVRIGEVDAVESREFGGGFRGRGALFSHVGMKKNNEMKEKQIAIAIAMIKRGKVNGF